MERHFLTYVTGMTLLAGLFAFSCSGGAADAPGQNSKEASMKEENANLCGDQLPRSDEEWRRILPPELYKVAREKGTEHAFTGKYWKTKTPGVYVCSACRAELFLSDDKFDSGTGWPSFTRTAADDRVTTQTDLSHGMSRTEVLCGRCGAHLGHVFEDGPKPTGRRYCINSISLDLVAQENEGKPEGGLKADRK